MSEESVLFMKNKPIKKLIRGFSKTAGKNYTGRTTVFHIGGGHKQRYRYVDHLNFNTDCRVLVERIEYDPNRTAYIALVRMLLNSQNKECFSYTLATHGVESGSVLEYGPNASISDGNRMPLKNIPTGCWVHSIELVPEQGAKVALSAGMRARIVRNDGSSYIKIKLPSGKTISVLGSCYATVGIVSNLTHNHRNLGKAGVSRWLGRRPTVRGIAMNPVDHPHGGRTCGGRHPVTPWGKLTRGVKTRKGNRK